MAELAVKVNELPSDTPIDPSRVGAINKAAQEMADLRAEIVKSVKSALTNQLNPDSKEELAKTLDRVRQVHDDIRTLTAPIDNDNFAQTANDADIALIKLGQAARLNPQVSVATVMTLQEVTAAAKEFVNVTTSLVQQSKAKQASPELTAEVERQMSEQIKSVKERVTGGPAASEKFERATAATSASIAKLQASVKNTPGDLLMS